MMSEEELDQYGDTGITSGHAKVPKWLIWTYIIMPIVGIAVFYLYWNGSQGWLDRGYWKELQRAANTTFPQISEKKAEY
jgi:hypothetical protein